MRHRILKFKDHEWMQLASLLERGYTFTEVLSLLDVKYERSVLLERMKENVSLQDIILEETRGKFHNYLSFFIRLNSLYEAIYSSLHMVEFEKQLKRELVKKTAYPLFIFIVSFFIIYLFSNFVIPQLLSSFDNHENQMLYGVLSIIKNGSIFICMIFILLMFSFILIQKNRFLSDLFYAKAIPNLNIGKDFISYFLSGYLKTLHERGLSSKQSFQFLNALEGNRYLVKTIRLLNQQLTLGMDMTLAIQSSKYLSKQFKMNYLIAAHNGEFEKTLESFMVLQREKWFLMIKKISICVQCISYAFIGVLVICVYQIMLIPLQMLETM